MLQYDEDKQSIDTVYVIQLFTKYIHQK